METYNALGKQQWEKTNDVQMKLFSHNRLYQSTAKGNTSLL